MSDSIVVQAPQPGTNQLFLLFHGVGADAAGLVPLAKRLAAEFPQAAVVSVASPFASDLGGGAQWFSVRGVTEQNRSERMAPAMPLFAETVRHWQQEAGVAAQATVLVGFSQGAIMTLESARLGQGLAGRIVSFAGRFAYLPDAAPAATTIHLVHGSNDPVIPAANSVAAAQRLQALGAAVTLDVAPGAGHEISPAMMAAAIGRLRGESAAR